MARHHRHTLFSVELRANPCPPECANASSRPRDDDLAGLPLVEVTARGASDAMAVILSGDGGWAGLDREVAAALAAGGIPVAGVDSLRYFWTRRTPEGAAADLTKILGHYLAAWNKRFILLLGYSLGADVLPFLANRLEPQIASRVRVVALLGQSHDVDFEFHLTDWIPGRTTSGHRPVLPEARKLPAPRLLCVYGKEETDSLCLDLESPRWERVPLSGSHHFGVGYEAIVSAVLAAAGEPPE